MISVVVTGNTGSGKSTFSSFFSELGIDVICADEINANIFKYCKFISCQINQIIGSVNMEGDCEVDKAKLRNIIFNNSIIKKYIESILHPLIYENLALQKSLHPSKPYIILEIPLLFESQSIFDDVDVIILITTEYTDMQRRIIERSGISPEQAECILNSQVANKDKFAASSAIVTNNSDIESLQNSAFELDHYLRSFGRSQE